MTAYPPYSVLRNPFPGLPWLCYVSASLHMRIKRPVMSALYRAIFLAGSRMRDGGVTILSYHSLDDLGTPLSVPPHLFERHARLLAREGCPTFTMSEVRSHLAERRPFPHRAVALTFDDGFSNLESVGAPILRRYGLKATVYIITGMVGRATRWTDGGVSLPSVPLLTWRQIEALASQGVEVGAHTVTHGFLTQHSHDALRSELEASRHMLQHNLGVAANAFAYPQGDYDDRVVRATKAVGYTSAVTVDQGRATLTSDPFTLPRLLVSGNTSLNVMRAFTAPTVGPAYKVINLVYRKLLGRAGWPRRAPGEVDSAGSVPMERMGEHLL